MKLRPLGIKYYLTVLYYLVQTHLPTNSTELWKGSDEGHKQGEGKTR